MAKSDQFPPFSSSPNSSQPGEDRSMVQWYKNCKRFDLGVSIDPRGLQAFLFYILDNSGIVQLACDTDTIATVAVMTVLPFLSSQITPRGPVRTGRYFGQK